MATIIRRIDDLGRIVIPREIRDLIGGAPEGTKFKIEAFSTDIVLIRKVRCMENLLNNIIYLKNYVSSPDLKDDLSDDDVNEINNKLDEINKIINIKDYIRKD